MRYEAKFGKDTVIFLITGNDIQFLVNGELNKTTITNKVAITKWLIKQFNNCKKIYPYLTCNTHKEDGLGEYREKQYLRLGFQKFNGYFFWSKNPDDYKPLEEEEAFTITLSNKEKVVVEEILFREFQLNNLRFDKFCDGSTRLKQCRRHQDIFFPCCHGSNAHRFNTVQRRRLWV